MPETAERKPRILLLGPLPAAPPKTAEPIGGARMRFAETIRQLEQRDLDLDIVNTARSRQNLSGGQALAHTLLAGLRAAGAILRRGRRSDLVFLNMSVYGALPAASVIWILCRLLRRPLVIWFFGEYLAAAYRQGGTARRWLMNRTYLRSDLVCVEVAREFQYFIGIGRGNFRQFPNTRDLPYPAGQPDRDRVRRLLFIGQLRMEKGLSEMLDVTRNLPADCRLQVFGPRMSNTDFALFDGHPRAAYGGVLAPEDVPGVIAEHDLLLLPSYREGQPGIIAEAFQCGVPVVATTVGGVPDLVQHETSGLLIEPRSAPQLRAAITRLLDDQTLYQRLCRGARRRGEAFRSGPHYDRLVTELRRVAGEPTQPQQTVMRHPSHTSRNDRA